MSYSGLLISAGLSVLLLLIGVVSVLVMQGQIAAAFFIGILCGAGIASMVYISRHLRME